MTVRALRARWARPAATLLLVLAAGVPAAAQQPAEEIARAEAAARYIQPPAPIAELFSRDPSYARLDAPSPDRRFFLVPRATELSSLELMSRPTLRLAELEIRPATDRLWHLDTYGMVGLRVFDLEQRRFREVAIPEGTFLSDLVWSPDGRRVAFLAHLPRGTEVWTADAATGRASRLSDARVLATLGTEAQTAVQPSRMLQWTPEGTLLTLMVPADRGREPARGAVPQGPMVRRTRPEPTPTRTYSNLLRTPHDAALFEHFTRAQLVELAPGRRPRAIGEPRMYRSISLSPDGRHVLATFIDKPFSFITSHQGFPARMVVLERAGGQVVSTLDEQPLREGARGRGERGGLRGLAWRPDGAGLAYLRRQGRGDDATHQVMLLAAPFDTAAARVVASSEDEIREVAFTRDGARALATVARDDKRALVHWDLRQGEPERRTLVDFHHPDSLFALPGELWTERTPNGVEFALVSSAGDAVYLRGAGYQPDFRPRPFVDRVAIADGARARLFEGDRESWDRPLVALDADLGRMIVAREGMHDFPDSFLWSASSAPVNLTENPDPFPELTAARRVDFSFRRRDGVEVQGRVSLPLGYQEGQKVPAIFWTYPREFHTPEEYTRSAIEARNRNAYTHLTWLRWSDLWLTQGYALVHPDIPIIGENYNDGYISNLVDATYGAMRAVDGLGMVDMDRIGHGGHSYGAFATANLLAHTPFFKAGIAGDGAYNRSLTPTGFQAEPRDIWSAPSTYLEMSPFFKANQINTPLLMYHGGDDNNTGTWPIQSERLMHALTGLGKTAALYVYPFESHTPRALDNNLDMWARWIDWFDRYVKRPGGASAEPTSEGQ
jgi:dipeptidyl aminopeptidase/acylaminoacyl peptidase